MVPPTPPKNTSIKYDFRKTRLYELLEYLKPKHQKKILQVINLEFSRPQDKQGILLQAIIKHIQKKGKKPLSKQELVSLIGIDSTKMNYMISDIFKRVCKILPLTSILQEYELQQIQILASFFRENDLNINAEYALEDIKKSLYRKAKRNHDFHYYQMKYYEFHVIEDNTRQYNQDFYSMIENLDAFYAESKLRLLCEETNRNRIIAQHSKVFKSEELKTQFLSNTQAAEFYNSPSVEVYFRIYQMLTASTTESYQKTYTLAYQLKASFAPDIQLAISKYLMNQCIYFINKYKGSDSKQYAVDYLKHIQSLDKIDLLLDKDQKFPLATFHNIIHIGLIAEDSRWGEDFINKTSPNLSTDNQRFMQLLHLALVALHENDLMTADQCILEIDEIPKDDVPFVILYYKLSIQILFQTQTNLDIPLNKAEAFRKYIGRIKEKGILADDKFTALTNFTLFFRRIVSIDAKADAQKWKKLVQEFSTKFNETAYADWLQSLIDDKNNRR